MTTYTPTATMARRAVLTIAGLLVASVTFAQSIRIGPARPGGDPVVVSNNSFPSPGLTGAPSVAVQQGVLTIAVSATSAVTASLTVPDSNFVRVRFAGTLSTDTTASSSFSDCVLGMTVVDATHVTVSATRSVLDASSTTTCAWQVSGYTSQSIASVQRASVVTNPATISVVISAVNVSKTEIDFLGIAGVGGASTAVQRMGYCQQTDSTHLSCTGGATSTIVGYQVWEWR